jgi:hypothetical protein
MRRESVDIHKIIALVGVLVALQALGIGPARALPFVPGFGIKGGMNISKVSADVDELTDEANRTGLVGGAWARLPLAGLSVQAEALYSQKGFADARAGERTGVEVRYNYIDVPVTARWAFPLPAVTPYLYVGVQLGFLVGAEGKNLLSEWANDVWIDIKDSSASTAWAMVVGAGVDIGKAHVDLRYNYGLSDINDTAIGAETKDRTFALMVGFQIF